MLKRIVNYLNFIIIFILFLTAIYVFIFSINNKDVSLFGYKFYIIKTNSMAPTLNVNDVIISKEADYEKLDKNTIITFDFNTELNMPNTHRIVGYYYKFIDNDTVKYDSTFDYDTVELFEEENPSFKVVGYRTKGDNLDCDIDLEPVLFESIKGVYIKKSNFLSIILSVITNFYGFLLFIFIPLVSLLILQIISILKMLDKRKGVVRKQ